MTYFEIDQFELRNGQMKIKLEGRVFFKKNLRQQSDGVFDFWSNGGIFRS